MLQKVAESLSTPAATARAQLERIARRGCAGDGLRPQAGSKATQAIAWRQEGGARVAAALTWANGPAHGMALDGCDWRDPRNPYVAKSLICLGKSEAVPPWWPPHDAGSGACSLNRP